MADLATLQTRLDAIDAILAAGVSQAVIDGRSVTYDLKALASERDKIRREIAVRAATHPSVRRGRYNPYYSANGY